MPIKKRTTIPKPTATPAEGFVLPGRPLEDLLKEHNQKASDAAWNDDDKTCIHHHMEAAKIRERLANGELYDTDF